MSAWLTIHDIVPTFLFFDHGFRLPLVLMRIQLRSQLVFGPGGIYLHTYHHLKDAFFC
jgi:hypothetical protein